MRSSFRIETWVNSYTPWAEQELWGGTRWIVREKLKVGQQRRILWRKWMEKRNRDKEFWETELKEWNGGVSEWLGRKKKRWKKIERRWKERRFIVCVVWYISWAGCTLENTLNDISVALLVGLGEKCLILCSYLLIWIGRRILLRLRSLL